MYTKIAQNIRIQFSKIKKMIIGCPFFEFIVEEKIMSLFLFLSITIIIVFGTINNACFDGKTLKVLSICYDIAVAISIGITFYFFQVFFPKRNIRMIANRDTNLLINVILHGLFFSIFDYYYPDIKNSNKQKIYNDKNAELVIKSLKLKEVINYRWNKAEMTWLEEINKTVKNFDVAYDKILMKYVNVVSWKMLKNLEQINRNTIFTSSREGMLSQNSVNEVAMKRIFFCMKNLRKISKKSYSLERHEIK